MRSTLSRLPPSGARAILPHPMDSSSGPAATARLAPITTPTTGRSQAQSSTPMSPTDLRRSTPRSLRLTLARQPTCWMASSTMKAPSSSESTIPIPVARPSCIRALPPAGVPVCAAPPRSGRPQALCHRRPRRPRRPRFADRRRHQSFQNRGKLGRDPSHDGLDQGWNGRTVGASAPASCLSPAERPGQGSARDRFSRADPVHPRLDLRSGAGLNKGEARNALARALFFHRHGEIRDRPFENQRYRASGLNLTIAAITLWNTVYLSRAVAELRVQCEVPPDTLLSHIGPLGWEHISLNGDYVWPSEPFKDGFRPLRNPRSAFLDAA